MCPQTPPVIKLHLLLPWDGGEKTNTLKEQSHCERCRQTGTEAWLSSGFKLSAPYPQSCWASVCLGGKWEGVLPYLVFEGERRSRIQAFVGCRVLPPHPLATTQLALFIGNLVGFGVSRAGS